MDKAARKGERYFREGRVLWVVKCGEKVFSKVLGTYPYYIEIDMKRGENRCTCPIGKDCKHVHATMKALEEGFYIESTDPSIELNPEMAVDRFFLENPKQGLEIIIKELEYMLDNDESGSEVVRLFRKCFRLLKIYPSEEHFLKIKKDFNEFQRLFGDWALTEYLGEEINEAEKLLSNPS